MNFLLKNTFANLILLTTIIVCFVILPNVTEAATLVVSPATGVYKSGSTFTVTVAVNTSGAPVNAADGTVSFNPRELAVVSVSRGSSIFNLWTTEPTFSNTAGTISFSGGVPTGYTGAFGQVLSITFRTLNSGTSRVSLTGASVLAADGRGTNVLTAMSGGTYTISAVDTQPTPEAIVEFVAPANTPAAPQVTSDTHLKDGLWSKEKTGVFSWTLPAGVTAVRTALDSSPVAIPTKVYDSPLKSLTLNDLSEGISYLHIQFKNSDGWGKVAHYKIAIDSEKPELFEIGLPEDNDFSNPTQILQLNVKDKTSPVTKFKIQLDGADPYEYNATSTESTLKLENLTPGYHTIVIEAFDGANNSIVASYSFTITSFEKPVFTDFPGNLNAGVTPVIKGTTKPNATVQATLLEPNGTEVQIKAVADGEGVFTLVPEKAFNTGIYKLSAVAIDTTGAQSEASETITIIVSTPGYVAIGTFLISFLSLLIPLIALSFFTWVVFIYSLRKMGRLKQRVIVESEEAAMMLATEFRHLDQVILASEEKLQTSHKTNKLTKAETELFVELRAAIKEAKRRVGKEVDDVTQVFKN